MIRNSKTRQDGLTKIKDKGVPNLVTSVIANPTKVLSIRVGKIYEHTSVFLFPLTNLDL